ncbi:MAG: hypothetical protein ACK41O_21795, partial [Runella zeae]
RCQLVYQHLFIPEKTTLSPLFSEGELRKILKNNLHIIHPEFGLVELTEPLNWKNVLKSPSYQSSKVIQPPAQVFIPSQIKSFQIVPLSIENLIEELTKEVVPNTEQMRNIPLNVFEKIKLNIYKSLLSYNKDTSINSVSTIKNNKSLENLLGRFLGEKWLNEAHHDFEALMERNQKQLDKLIDLLKNNPNEALKYAIPLDNEGVSRGQNDGQFNLSKRWFDFSLFGNSFVASGDSNILLEADAFQKLQQQYRQTAEALITQKEYKKAAFVYMKLLKDNFLAAQTLEKGKLFQEAAALYLKNKNTHLAAQCYEKGNMIQKAIELYIELGENEKIGDLYMSIHQPQNAIRYYEKLAAHYQQNCQYVKAALVYKNKIKKPALGQNILLEGWRSNHDAFNCLNNYFSNIEEPTSLMKSIQKVYSSSVNARNSEIFLKVISHEFKKHSSIADDIKEIAYKIIAEHATIYPHIVTELKAFEVSDNQLIKDILRFKNNHKQLGSKTTNF